MLVNRRVVELGYIASGVDARNVGLHIFIHYHSLACLNRCMLENTCVQGNAQADANHIGLYLAALLRLYITRNAIFRDNRLNFIAMDDLNAKFLSDVVNHFTAVGIQTVTEPVGAAHYPGCIELTYREAIA